MPVRRKVAKTVVRKVASKVVTKRPRGRPRKVTTTAKKAPSKRKSLGVGGKVKTMGYKEATAPARPGGKVKTKSNRGTNIAAGAFGAAGAAGAGYAVGKRRKKRRR